MIVMPFGKVTLILIATALIAVTASDTSSQQIHKIEGETLDKDSKVIASVLVRIYRGATKINEVRTDGMGSYSISFDRGSPITTVRYDHSDWNPATINDVSGSRDHRINKVLHRIGSELPLGEADALFSTLSNLYYIDEANNIPRQEIQRKYRSAIEEVRVPKGAWFPLSAKVNSTVELYGAEPRAAREWRVMAPDSMKMMQETQQKLHKAMKMMQEKKMKMSPELEKKLMRTLDDLSKELDVLLKATF